MCRYCELKPNVGGVKTNELVQIEELVDGHQIFELFLYRYIDEKTGERCNELVMETSVRVGRNVHQLEEKDIKIKYCPFCGEEL